MSLLDSFSVSSPFLHRISQWKDWTRARRRDQCSNTQSFIGRHDQPATEKEQAAKEKAQARRAQVRRAQLRHRQRKADHIKQLELDISQLREMVAAAELETAEMQKSNDGLRQALFAAGIVAPPSSIRRHDSSNGHGKFLGHSQPTTTSQRHSSEMEEDELVPTTSAELFSGINMDDVVASLSMSDVLGTPCFTISTAASSYSATPPPVPGVQVEPSMTLDQETRAINFILALEHGCWDHFLLGDFHSHHEHIECSEGGHGHHLMASAYLMSTAPESIYWHRNAFEDASQAASPAPLEWPSPGISLRSLYGLALSLNQDTKELTPVQAWFELAARYPLDTLFEDGVLASLEIECSHAVRCVMFGAMMTRASFEDIVDKVLGPSPYGQVPLDLEQWMYTPRV